MLYEVITLDKKVIFTELGEMLFTHFGVSGPLVLSMSSYLDKDKLDEYEVVITSYSIHYTKLYEKAPFVPCL